MVCKNCGNIVVKTDSHCKVCGVAILPEGVSQALEQQATMEQTFGGFADVTGSGKPQKRGYRSRFALLLIYWLGGYAGLHYAWMGNSEKAVEEAGKFVKHVLLCIAIVGIFLLLADMCKYLINLFAIAFGKYETDYYGNPIVWSKRGKPELN